MLKRIAAFLCVWLVCMLTACGGGSNPGTSLFGTGSGTTGTGGTSGTTSTGAITVTLSNTVVTTAAPVTVTAKVTDATGSPVAGQVVKFTTAAGLGTFAVSSALTDATGTASTTLAAASSGSGADQVVATTTLSGTALSATAGFQLTATSATIASFTSDIATVGPYGQANLTVTVGGVAAGTPVNLALTSACVSASKATLTPAASTTTTGTATFTFRDNGCGATQTSDTIQVNIVGSSATQTLSLGLTAPTVSSITFTSATPSTIYLKGSGLTQTSTVLFTVVDTAGNGLPNQSVTLSLLTDAGGLTLNGGTSSVVAVSDSNGHVSALINSGTVPTPVSVQATLGTSGITTVSSGLSVAVGLPSELNFSLSQGTKNIEGYDIDGTTNTYNIIASDRLANPVPTGTAINFIAEGGQVEPSAETALQSGLARASANFIASDPRPLDGRITVVAYALGEESFLDASGTNVWNPAVDTQFQDLGALFLSRKFLQTYFPQTDQLIPLSIPGDSDTSTCFVSSSALLALDVSIPTVGGSTCDGVWGPAYVRRATETVLSTSAARPLWYSAPAGLYAPSAFGCPVVQDVTSDPSLAQNLIQGYAEGTGDALRPQSFYAVGQGTTIYNLGATGAFSFLVADNNPVRLNPVAATSTVTATTTTAGLAIALQGGSPVPSTTEVTAATVSWVFTAPTTYGTVTINITSPSGLITTEVLGLSTNAPPTTNVVACQ